MATTKYILINPILSTYQVDLKFIHDLEEVGRLKIVEENSDILVPENQLSLLEKMLRMNSHLNINAEGIDTVLHLIDKMEKMQSRIHELTEKLNLLDDDWNDYF